MTNSSTQEGEITLQHRSDAARQGEEDEDDYDEPNSRIENVAAVNAAAVAGLDARLPAAAQDDEEDEDVTLATTPDQEEMMPDGVAADAVNMTAADSSTPTGPKSDISSLRQKLEEVGFFLAFLNCSEADMGLIFLSSCPMKPGRGRTTAASWKRTRYGIVK